MPAADPGLSHFAEEKQLKLKVDDIEHVSL